MAVDTTDSSSGVPVGGKGIMDPVRMGIVGGTGRIHAAPTLVAFGNGYFQEEGVDVELVETGGAPDAMPKVASGELDVTMRGPGLDFFLNWRRKAPMVMVADHGLLRPGRGTGTVVARPELVEQGKLRDYSDLRGKKIGLSARRGHHDWMTLAWALRRGGLTFDDVDVVTVPFGPEDRPRGEPSDRHKALANGTIDLTTVARPESIVAGRETGAFVVWKDAYEIQPGRPAWVVIFSHHFRSERPEEARRYVRGYLRGVRAYHDAFEHGIERDEIIKVLAEQAHATEDSIANQNPVGLNPDGYVNMESVTADLRWLEEEGVLPRQVPVDQIVDHSYLDDALVKLGKYRAP